MKHCRIRETIQQLSSRKVATVCVVCVGALAVLSSAPAAHAQSDANARPKCTFSMSNIAFGTIDIATGRQMDTTGTFTYACTGDDHEVVRICPSFGTEPDGGRVMKDASGHTLAFNLYQDADRHNVWGTWFGKASQGPTIDVPLRRSGSGNGSATVYARIIDGQTSIAPGNYSATQSGNTTSIGYDYASKGSCSSIKHVYEAQRLPFTTTATVKESAPAAALAASTAAAAAPKEIARGMKLEEVAAIYGAGKMISDNTTSDGLQTQTYNYETAEKHLEVVYVNGIVVRYTVSSK